MTCSGLINLGAPVRAERRRGFQPPWYTVFVYQCPVCHREVHIRASHFQGRRPIPGSGAVQCHHAAMSPYRRTGHGNLVFCRACLCSFVPSDPTDTDPSGARLHERNNPRQHGG